MSRNKKLSLAPTLGTALAVALTLSFGAISPVFAQESETADLSEVVEHIAEDSSEVIAQADQGSGSPLASLAEQAVSLLAGAQGKGLSTGGAMPMCPILKRWSGHGCGISAVLSGENAITDEQYEKYYQLKMKMMDEMGPLKVEYMSKKRHLRDLLTKEEIDVKEVKKMNDRVASLKKEMTAMKLDYKLQMAQVLTGAQRQELRKTMLKHKGHCGRSGSSSMMRSWMMKRMGK